MAPKKRRAVAQDDSSSEAPAKRSRKAAVADSDSDDETVRGRKRGAAAKGSGKKASSPKKAPPKKAPPKKSSPKKSAASPKKSSQKSSKAATMSVFEKQWAKEEEFLETIMPDNPWWTKENRAKLVELFRRGDRFMTLEHHGPIFAPPYEPHGTPFRYDGKTLKLTAEEEEVATMFAEMRNSPYYKLQVFRKNFFREWTALLHKRPEARHVRDLALCDFDAFWDRFQRLQEEKKAMPAAEKKRLREQKAAEEEKYRFCEWDGRKEKIANPKVEPPGLFRGRGQHPKMGVLKRRIQPEDVAINCSDRKKAPKPPAGHKWKEVVTNHKTSWLACWSDTVMGDQKTVMLDKSSAWKQFKDMEKFDKAQRLCKIVPKIRGDYQAKYKSKDIKERQMAIATYFIDRLALRVGGEKGEDEADTVGCCSLRAEHVSLLTTMGNTPSERERDGDPREGDPARKKKYWIHFDFLGKDSIRYVNDMELDPEVYTLVQELLRGKDNRPIAANQLFDRIQPSDLNQYFKDFMPGLSAKVFRTYNASYCLDQMFRSEPVDSDGTEDVKLVYFNKANTRVAILCNHQKTVTKGAAAAAEVAKQKQEEVEEFSNRLAEAHAALLPHVDKHGFPKKGFDAKWDELKDEFEQAEQDIQWNWLDKYGTDEEKAEYRKELKDGKKSSGSKSSGSKSKSSAGSRAKSSPVKRSSAPKRAPPKASPFASSPKKRAPSPSRKKLVSKVFEEEEEDDDEPAPTGKKRSRAKVSDSEDDDDVPAKRARGAAAKKKPAPKPAKGGKKGKVLITDDDDDSDIAVPPKKGAAKRKPAGKKSSPKKMLVMDDDSED